MKVISRLIQMRMSVFHQSPNNEQVDNFSASDSDSEEEVDSALETTLMIRPNNNIYNEDARLPAGRNDRNVKWQQLVT